MTSSFDAERFQREAEKYASYLETPEGRLRVDLAFANLEEVLPKTAQPLHALDLGGGTGALAVRLARLGIHVTVLDASLPMLDLAKRSARQAGMTDRITLKQGDAVQLAELFETGCFDLVLCHNVLEFVDDPCTVLRSAARLLRDPLGMISVLVRNQAGEVLKTALVNGDLAAAERTVGAECGDESLYGGKVRLFRPESLKDMLAQAAFTLTAEHGVRVLADYLPPRVSRDDEYERIFALECKLGGRPEFGAMARYTQCIARRTGRGMKDAQ